MGRLALLLLVGAGIPAAAEERLCVGTLAEIGDVAEVEAKGICEGARAAESALARCGLRPWQRYHVRFVPDLRNPYGNCIFGQFRASANFAAIVDPAGTAALVAAIPDDDPMSVYKRLPADELHRSLIVHEIAHAVVHQNLAVAPCHAVHEYIAGMVQIGALPEPSRRVFLESFAGVESYTSEMFNDIVLAMSPARFAAAAYRHFERPENGCAFVRRLLTESDVLPRLPQ